MANFFDGSVLVVTLISMSGSLVFLGAILLDSVKTRERPLFDYSEMRYTCEDNSFRLKFREEQNAKYQHLSMKAVNERDAVLKRQRQYQCRLWNSA